MFAGRKESYIIPLILMPLTGNYLSLHKVTAHNLVMSDPNRCTLNDVAIDQMKQSLLSGLCQRKAWAHISLLKLLPPMSF